jgi:shikimate dehydrogenase
VSTQQERVSAAFAVIESERSVLAGPGGAAARIGLLGRGIGASLTPIMHEAEGRRLGLTYRYDLIDFDRLGLEDADLGAVLEAARAADFWGLNVTYPFKQQVIPLLDGLAPEAAAIGAVNTVVLRDGRRIGHNTDCWGFAQSVRTGLGAVQFDHVVQIGAGGAGAAVAHALVQLGAMSIDIVDSDLARARYLADRVANTSGTRTQALLPDQLIEVIGLAAGIVNATPVGMEKLPGLPLDPGLLRRRQWVADIIYFPRETELLRRAADLGCRILPGRGMAIYQAVRAFRLFTDVEPDAAEMSKTFAAYA